MKIRLNKFKPIVKAGFILSLSLSFSGILKAQGPVSSGMIAHYCFDGDANDALGVKHLTVTGPVLTTDRKGRANRAYYFDGVDDFMQAPSDVWFSKEFTVSLWLYVSSFKNTGKAFDFSTGAPGDNVTYIPTIRGVVNDAFIIRRDACASPVEEGCSAPPFPIGKWVHVAVVLRGSAGEVWRDGVNATITKSSGLLGPPCNITRTLNYFGRSPWTHDQYFHGKIDDVRIFNRALSAAEIDTIYKLDIACNPCDALVAGFKDSLTSCFAYQFTDTSLISEKGIATWKWDFGDGASSLLKNPAHIYPGAGSYNVRLIVTDSAGCNDTAIHTLNIIKRLFADAGKDTSICKGTATTITAALNGKLGKTYSWAPAAGLSAPTSAATLATLTATTQYILTVTDSLGCVDKDSVLVIITNNANIITSPKLFKECNDATIQFKATGGETYSWSPSSGLDNPNSSTPILKDKKSGVYFVTGKDKNGCTGTDSVVVKIYPSPIINAGPEDTIACTGSKIMLHVTGAKNYEWKPAENLSSATIPNPELYVNTKVRFVVRGVDSLGCSASDTISMDIYPLNQVKASAEKRFVDCQNNVTTLFAANAESYRWDPALFCEQPNNNNTRVHPTKDMMFTVYGVDKNGCTSSDTVSLLFEGKSMIKIPSAFTPDNDHINDRLKIIDLCNFNLSQLSIYNRWGQCVFIAQDINNYWDGTSNGKQCDVGVYYYLLTGKSNEGEALSFKGDISLLR